LPRKIFKSEIEIIPQSLLLLTMSDSDDEYTLPSDDSSDEEEEDEMYTPKVKRNLSNKTNLPVKRVVSKGSKRTMKGSKLSAKSFSKKRSGVWSRKD
jgi:hypothetical protein